MGHRISQRRVLWRGRARPVREHPGDLLPQEALAYDLTIMRLHDRQASMRAGLVVQRCQSAEAAMAAMLELQAGGG